MKLTFPGAAQDTAEFEQLEVLLNLLDVAAAYPNPEENSADIQIALDRQQVILQTLYLLANTGTRSSPSLFLSFSAHVTLGNTPKGLPGAWTSATTWETLASPATLSNSFFIKRIC